MLSKYSALYAIDYDLSTYKLNANIKECKEEQLYATCIYCVVMREMATSQNIGNIQPS